jgi:parallel beta-helix repeat protein
MNRYVLNTIIALALGAGLAMALLWLLGAPSLVRADPGTLYVAPDGSDANTCSSYGNRCRTIQRAVDVAAPGDEILVATGTYTDVHQRQGYTQTAYISRTVTIQGGYSGDFSAWDPATHHTILDARGLGRAIYAFGQPSAHITVTLEGLRFTNGSAGDNDGGGILVQYASPVISGCHTYSNTAKWGGGIGLEDTRYALLTNNHIYSNTASTAGGGVRLQNSGNATLTDNHIYANTSGGGSGGLLVSVSDDVTLAGNEVYSNTAENSAGIRLSTSHNGTLEGNTVYRNTATTGLGGGIRLEESIDATLTGNHVYGNTTEQGGGGIYVSANGGVTLTDNHVYSNTAKRDGGGTYLMIGAGVPSLKGNHVYSNTAKRDGGGIYLVGGQTPMITDNYIHNNTGGSGGGMYSHSIDQLTLAGNWVYSNTAEAGGGVYLSACDDATLTGNQVFSNTAGTDGGGIIVGSSDDVTLRDNDVYLNTAERYGGIQVNGSVGVRIEFNRIYSNTATTTNGGGIAVTASSHNALLEDNDVYSNTAQSKGGGIRIGDSLTVTLRGNRVYSNTAYLSGGGIELSDADSALLEANDVHHNVAWGRSGIDLYTSHNVTLESNHVHDNVIIDYSGAIGIDLSNDATLINNMVVDNRAIGSTSYLASGILVLRSLNARLLHTTVARNTGGDGIGVTLAGVSEQQDSIASLTNTILVSQTVGILVRDNCTATLEATLWGQGEWANGDEWAVGGSGQVFTSTDVYGHPGFVDPDGGDYHITGGSEAHEAGVSTAVTDDIDGDARPYGSPDLGADEVACHVRLNDDATFYPTVQAGVGASTSATDVVKVAGTCRGVGSYAAVAYITKSLTVRGGYSPDFTAWAPMTYPTTLDAQGEGRVVYAFGQPLTHITTTLEALSVTGGAAPGTGGGVCVQYADAVISGCRVYSNTAYGSGGGIYLSFSDNAALTRNDVYNNRGGTGAVPYYGGGICVGISPNVVVANNRVYNNSVGSTSSGGGVCVSSSDGARLTNNMVADNEAGSKGSGIYIRNSAASLLHTTIARNAGGDGSGVYVSGSGGSNYSVATLTNTILVSHTVGVYVTSGNTATLEATLWGSGPWANGDEWDGSGQVFTSTDVYGDPAFVDPDNGDYHIRPSSAAAGAGLPAGVRTDIDGDPRSLDKPDLGADETDQRVYLPLVLRTYQ